jgi:hypothetical protein
LQVLVHDQHPPLHILLHPLPQPPLQEVPQSGVAFVLVLLQPLSHPRRHPDPAQVFPHVPLHPLQPPLHVPLQPLQLPVHVPVHKVLQAVTQAPTQPLEQSLPDVEPKFLASCAVINPSAVTTCDSFTSALSVSASDELKSGKGSFAFTICTFFAIFS